MAKSQGPRWWEALQRRNRMENPKDPLLPSVPLVPPDKEPEDQGKSPDARQLETRIEYERTPEGNVRRGGRRK